MGFQNGLEAITYDKLVLVVGEIKARVLEVEIRETSNEHGELFVTAIAGSQEKEYILYEGTGNIGLFYRYEDGVSPLFQGVLSEMSVTAEGDMYLISLHVRTFSSLMDIYKHNFSFQDLAMGSHQLIKSLMEPYLVSQVSLSIPDIPLGRIYLQYQETTWEFLKRFLSGYGVCLYPDSTNQGIWIRAGLWEQPEDISWDLYPYRVRRDMAPRDVGQDLKGQLTYEVDAYEILPLGACLMFHGKELYVRGLHRKLQGGLLVSRYELCFKEGMGIRQYDNPLISGISVNGIVMAVKRDQVCVRMETDIQTSCQEPYFFPYSTVAASPDGSGWYCMPKCGDQVRVFFPVSDEKEGYAVSNIQGEQSPAPDSPMGNPDIKAITTPDEKMVQFIENGILFSVSSGKGTVTLTNDGKAKIQGAQVIGISATDKIKIETEGELSITAGTRIQLVSEQGGCIDITDDTVEAKAAIIKANK